MVTKTTTLQKYGNSHFILIPKYWIDHKKIKDNTQLLMDIDEEIKISVLE